MKTPTMLLMRIGWMAAIWLLSVLSLAVVAGAVRFFMGLAGLTS